jgi:hypothetical protein
MITPTSTPTSDTIFATNPHQQTTKSTANLPNAPDERRRGLPNIHSFHVLRFFSLAVSHRCIGMIASFQRERSEPRRQIR